MGAGVSASPHCAEPVRWSPSWKADIGLTAQASLRCLSFPGEIEAVPRPFLGRCCRARLFLSVRPSAPVSSLPAPDADGLIVEPRLFSLPYRRRSSLWLSPVPPGAVPSSDRRSDHEMEALMASESRKAESAPRCLWITGISGVTQRRLSASQKSVDSRIARPIPATSPITGWPIKPAPIAPPIGRIANRIPRERGLRGPGMGAAHATLRTRRPAAMVKIALTFLVRLIASIGRLWTRQGGRA